MYEKTRKNTGKYTMLVKTSIITPLTDGFLLRILKYTRIKATNTAKQKSPSAMLTGYMIGCFAISPNETIENHKNAQISPNAPTADKPKDTAEVFRVQCSFKVFEKIRQKTDAIINAAPTIIKT